MKIKYSIILLILTIAYCACDDDPSRKVEFNQEEFRTNRAKWEELNLQNFTYEYSNSGYSYSGITSHISVEILNGETENITALVENGIQDADKYLIDDLFEEILNRYPDDGLADSSLKEIKVKYDKDYHFPTEVHYIYHIPEGMDGLWNMHQYIKNFELVK
ncbi:hypothetical protein DWB61_13745 [Ancylomarina euxinus]|uniref:Uncharacterized protein n=1 Tax=Ancylomarina euxinus TaxID=2283627 RepID=A0A425XYI4_9BACT|nr:DUF6174 domain-containing protein [Ancylomarina euxinus]MCZ4695849.1 DUF6174 domain-containing protein [Ancylomarina euxinus]MUP16087.1 hypothetical protein [Ancylomarina euxinus]RRG19808.1 hypothetical protein DWB61_13745 [Ancylomarina euxinus]